MPGQRYIATNLDWKHSRLYTNGELPSTCLTLADLDKLKRQIETYKQKKGLFCDEFVNKVYTKLHLAEQSLFYLLEEFLQDYASIEVDCYQRTKPYASQPMHLFPHHSQSVFTLANLCDKLEKGF